MKEYDVCVVIHVKANDAEQAAATAADRLDDACRHDLEWADVLDAEGNGRLTGEWDPIYSVEHEEQS